MKNLRKNDSRFICSVVRQWASLGGKSGGWHIDSCPDCRQFFAGSQAIERTLVRDAELGRTTLPEGLDRRIAQAVARSRQSRQPVRSRRRAAIVGIGAACAASLAVLVGMKFSGPTRLLSDAPATLSQAETVQLASDVVKLPGTLWDSVKPSATAVWQAEPLRREATDLVSDAKSAIGFLAANFLPSGYSAPRSEASPSS